jgi:chorismate-pyruvate lyase
MAHGSDAYAREVHLVCGITPCIYAFSLLRFDTLHDGGQNLDRLDTRSIEEVLFADPALERGLIAVIISGSGTVFYTRALIVNVQKFIHIYSAM